MKKLLCIAVLLMAVGKSFAQTSAVSSCLAVTQDFYRWYGTTFTYSAALRKKSKLFSVTLRAALYADYAAAAKNPGEIVGLDWDPFLAAQDTVVLTARTAHIRNGSCFVDMFAPQEKEAHVVPELQRTGSIWIFTNFHYPANGSTAPSDLLSALKHLKADRDRNPEIKK